MRLKLMLKLQNKYKILIDLKIEIRFPSRREVEKQHLEKEEKIR